MKATILIIDQSAAMREFIKYPLQYAGFETLEAMDTLEGLGILEQTTVHCIIMELYAQQLESFDLVEKIRATPLWTNIPILMTASLTDKDKYMEANRKGVNFFVCKPFDTKKITEKVKEFLSEIVE